MRNNREYWMAHVGAWRRSGMSQIAYARQQHIAKGSLGYWSCKLKREGHGGELVELPPAGPRTDSGPRRPIEVVVEGRYLLRVWPGTVGADVREVVTALEQR
jgi:hypothetical protein